MYILFNSISGVSSTIKLNFILRHDTYFIVCSVDCHWGREDSDGPRDTWRCLEFPGVPWSSLKRLERACKGLDGGHAFIGNCRIL